MDDVFERVAKVQAGLENLINQVIVKDEKSISLINYLNDHIIEIAQLSSQYKLSTIKRYETIQRHLEEFLGTINNESIKLNNVDIKYQIVY